MADALAITVNVDQAKAYVEGRRDALVDMIANRIDSVNSQFAERVRGNLSGAVLKKQSGNLFSSVMQEPAQIDGDEVYAAVTAGGDLAPYGIYFEHGGTGYYEIFPVNARALSFMMDGKRIFAKMIEHPPIPHLPWFGPEVPQAQEDMVAGLNEVINEVLNG